MAELRRRSAYEDRPAREEQVPYARAYAVEPEPEEESRNLLEEYFHALLRHKLLIAGFALGGVLLSLGLTLTTAPMYRTRTSLSIQSLNKDFMNMSSVDPTAGTPTDIAVQTEIRLLESDSLAERVRARLESEPHDASIPQRDLLSSLEGGLHLGQPAAIPFRQMLDETAKNVKVKPLGITQMLEITCDSWDPAFAAKYCNTLTNEFQEEDLENRGSEARKTSDWLMHQAADVRAKAEESQNKLIAATGGNGLILSEQSNSVGTDALRALQSELVKAQADRMEKQAEIASAEVSSGDMMPRSVQSSSYGAQKSKLLDLQQQVAALVPPLTEENPRVIHLRAQIKETQRSLDQETSNNQGRLLNEYEAAKHRESLLRMSYEARLGAVSSDLQKASTVDLLRREVQSEQQLYQTLLQRAKEAGFASAMQANTIRTVDAARKPLLPVYPRRLTSAAIGLLLGGLLGVLLAFFVDRRSNLLRSPGESVKLLQVEELGVVPSPRALVPAGGLAMRNPLRLTAPKAPPTLKDLYGDSADENLSLISEAYQGITHSILLAGRKTESRVYIVTSPNAEEGKTTVVSNLGVALSSRGRRVLLIDADLRKPRLHKAFELENGLGLSDVLRGSDTEVSSLTGKAVQASGYANLDVLTSGSNRRRVSETLHSERMPDLLKTFAGTYDIVLIDTPPMLHITDARVLAHGADAAILVFRAGLTTRDQARDAQALLLRDDVPLVGSILNDFHPSRVGKYGYYRSYYAYQRGADERESANG